MEVDGWCGHGQPWRFPCPLGSLVTVPGGSQQCHRRGLVARRSLEQWARSCHVSGPAGSSCSVPKACQKEPGASPDRETLGCALIPWVRACSRLSGDPGMTLVQKVPGFFFFPFKRPGSRCRAGFPQCACLGPATPPLIPVGLPLPFPGAFPGQ